MGIEPRSGILNLVIGQDGRETQINENFARVAAIAIGAAISYSVVTPPATPTEGDVYIVPAGATGSWATHLQEVAHYSNGQWNYYEVLEGHTIPVIDSNYELYTFDGAAWIRTYGDLKYIDAYYAAVTTSLSTSAGTLILLDTAPSPTGGLTLSGNVLVTVESGRYSLRGLTTLLVTPSAVNASVELFVRVNSTNIRLVGIINVENNTATTKSSSFSIELNLTGGDVVGIVLGTLTNVTSISEVGGGASWLQLSKI